MPLNVRAARESDASNWLRMRRSLWPNSSSNHESDISAFFGAGLPGIDAVLIAELDDEVVGFAELSIRPWAEGCSSSNVAYLEGWFVEPEARLSGVGELLVREAEDWARSQGCSEFASDAEADNLGSRRAHAGVGFEEVGLVRCFRKPL